MLPRSYSYSYISIDCDDSEDNGFDVEPLIHGEFKGPILGKSSIYTKYPRSYWYASIGCGCDKLGNWFQNNQGLTRNIQYILTRKNKQKIQNLKSQVPFLNISWAIHNSNLYVNVIEEINDLYKKMLMIGKCNEVFWLCNDKIPDLLSA